MNGCRVVGATYANGWLIIVGASKTSPVPGSGMRRRHARRRILPSFGALRGDNTPTAALRGLDGLVIIGEHLMLIASSIRLMFDLSVLRVPRPCLYMLGSSSFT